MVVVVVVVVVDVFGNSPMQDAVLTRSGERCARTAGQTAHELHRKSTRKLKTYSGVCKKNARRQLFRQYIKSPPRTPHFNVGSQTEQPRTETSVFIAGMTDTPPGALNIEVGGPGGL